MILPRFLIIFYPSSTCLQILEIFFFVNRSLTVKLVNMYPIKYIADICGFVPIQKAYHEKRIA